MAESGQVGHDRGPRAGPAGSRVAEGVGCGARLPRLRSRLGLLQLCDRGSSPDLSEPQFPP